MATPPKSLKVSDLTPNAKNPRKVTDEKLAMLKHALLEFGDLSGIVYNRISKQLVGGHQRTKLFDADSAVVITKTYSKPTKTGTVAEGFVNLEGERFSYREVQWSKHQEMAANIAANKGAGEWDLPQLGEWLKELTSFDAGDFDINLTMFDSAELKEFDVITVKEHTRVGPTGVDEDEVPEVAPPRVKAGQVYRLGNHRLMCGSSDDRTNLTQLMDGKRAQLVFTSPPYNQQLNKFKPSGMQSESPNWVKKMGSAYFDSLPEDEYQQQQIGLLALLSDFTTPNASIFYNHKIRYRDKEIVTPYSWLARSAWKIRQEIIWDRAGSITLNARMFMPCDERIYWLTKGDFVFNDTTEIKSWSSVWRVAPKNEIKGVSAPFPNELPQRGIAACSVEGDLVLEPYGGTGTTLIAAEKLGRRCYAMEINPAYCDVILARWENYTGKTAKLVATAKAKAPLKSGKKAADQGRSREARA